MTDPAPVSSEALAEPPLPAFMESTFVPFTVAVMVISPSNKFISTPDIVTSCPL